MRNAIKRKRLDAQPGLFRCAVTSSFDGAQAYGCSCQPPSEDILSAPLVFPQCLTWVSSARPFYAGAASCTSDESARSASWIQNWDSRLVLLCLLERDCLEVAIVQPFLVQHSVRFAQESSDVRPRLFARLA